MLIVVLRLEANVGISTWPSLDSLSSCACTRYNTRELAVQHESFILATLWMVGWVYESGRAVVLYQGDRAWEAVK